MGTVTQYSDLRDYIRDSKVLINQNPMLYHFLTESLSQVIEGKVKVHKLFKLENGNNVIMVLLTTEVCLIYDNSFDESLIPRLSEELEFSKFIRYQFAGTKPTIDALFRLNGAEYETQKHRIIYKCTKVIHDFTPASGQMQMADIRRLDELVPLSEGFANEYYGKDYSQGDPTSRIVAGIQADTLYQWVDNGRICSIAQSLHEEHDFPVIGHFYTDQTKRGKGYGASIVHGLTKGLLGIGHEFVMLSTNALTPASNRVFQKVGYIKTGEYLLAYKNKK
jgi:RimJ/RimL family protein N-acetyltransferase